MSIVSAWRPGLIPARGSKSTRSLSSEMRRVDCGQWRASGRPFGPERALMWSSYAKRGTASSGCGSSTPPMSRPSAWTRKTGKALRLPRSAGLAALVRCSTSAVMKIVLPARERPVTPRRTCGPIVSRTRLSAAARASKRRSERRGKPKSSYWRRELERSGGFHEKRLGKANDPARVGVIGQFHHLLLQIEAGPPNAWSSPAGGAVVPTPPLLGEAGNCGRNKRGPWREGADFDLRHIQQQAFENRVPWPRIRQEL